MEGRRQCWPWVWDSGGFCLLPALPHARIHFGRVVQEKVAAVPVVLLCGCRFLKQLFKGIISHAVTTQAGT